MNRANVLLLDEFRLMSKDNIDTVLRKFLTLHRMPPYTKLTREERNAEYEKEKNLTLWLSSAYYSDTWAYQKCVDVFNAMLSGKHRQFIGAFPYELSLREGLLFKDEVEAEMLESDFNEIRWSMEMGAIFYGSENDAFFDFASISKNRRIKYPMLPESIAALANNATAVKIPPKKSGEIRLLSADVALMASKKHRNDAAAVFINQMLPTKSGRFSHNIVYTTVDEGMRTETLALKIRQLYDEFDCDYIVLDCQGNGLGVYDCLSRVITDPESGEVYPALSCCNDSVMAMRCTSPDAEKVIWSVKASAQFNSDCAQLLREGFRSGRIRLLANEYDAEEFLKQIIKGFDEMPMQAKLQLQLPYINTTLLVDELTKLEHEVNNGKIRVYERSGMRKDRYSSLAYNYYVATRLESQLARRQSRSASSNDAFIIKAPKYKPSGRTVRTARGGAKTNQPSWY